MLQLNWMGKKGSPLNARIHFIFKKNGKTRPVVMTNLTSGEHQHVQPEMNNLKKVISNHWNNYVFGHGMFLCVCVMCVVVVCVCVMCMGVVRVCVVCVLVLSVSVFCACVDVVIVCVVCGGFECVTNLQEKNIDVPWDKSGKFRNKTKITRNPHSNVQVTANEQDLFHLLKFREARAWTNRLPYQNNI